MSRVSSNTAGLDYPTIVTAIDEGHPFQGAEKAVLKDDDLLEEYRFR